jgi:hypothetical protein
LLQLAFAVWVLAFENKAILTRICSHGFHCMLSLIFLFLIQMSTEQNKLSKQRHKLNGVVDTSTPNTKSKKVKTMQSIEQHKGASEDALRDLQNTSAEEASVLSPAEPPASSSKKNHDDDDQSLWSESNELGK